MRLELTTLCLEGRCSSQLSYTRLHFMFSMAVCLLENKGILLNMMYLSKYFCMFYTKKSCKKNALILYVLYYTKSNIIFMRQCVGMKIMIWVDEAWRWPWMWPVVAAALCYNPENIPEESFITSLNDSKKISEKQRNKLYTEIIELSRWTKPTIFFGLWVVDNFVIDEINIRQANREAMNRALHELILKLWKIKKKKKTLYVQVDGRDNYHFDCLIDQPEYIIWWDGKIPEIWWASIIAKVFRDKLMAQYATLYPDYHIEKHKWYGTKKHSDMLKQSSDVLGIHRTSYKPIKLLLDNT